MDATNWPLLMAGAVVMMLPVLLLLFLLQRAFWPAGARGPLAPWPRGLGLS
jgi:ABC-type glycerol-3-phosphate transport system permease component